MTHPTASPELLRVEHLTRRFGAVRAVDDVSFSIARGEIIGLIGPNGSGKTTLLNLLAGIQRPTSGSVLYNGRSVEGKNAARRARLGIAKAAQITQPFARLSLLDNVAVGASFGSDQGRTDLARSRQSAETILRRVGFDGDLQRPATNMPIQMLKRLELARILACRPQLGLFDEIFAGIEMRMGEKLIEAIRELHSDGLTVLLVEHRVDLLFRLVSRILVLDQGRLIADAAPGEILKDLRVVEAYFGRRQADRMAELGQL